MVIQQYSRKPFRTYYNDEVEYSCVIIPAIFSERSWYVCIIFKHQTLPIKKHIPLSLIDTIAGLFIWAPTMYMCIIKWINPDDLHLRLGNVLYASNKIVTAEEFRSNLQYYECHICQTEETYSTP